jgi:aryl-alcohol dehydrogenase-like predicted oxidoreductase
MNYRNLGRSGVKVSEVGIGADMFGSRVDKGMVTRIVLTGLDHGVNFIDTADIYGHGMSEDYLSDALQGHREELVIATKGRSSMGPGKNDQGASRYHLMNALEASLRRLRTDHVDLYQVHAMDLSTPLEETLRTLDDMVRSGKVRYVGASNFYAWQLCRCNDLAERYGWSPLVTDQPHYHMLEREVERESVPYCRAFNVGILPYFPLAGGLLTGRYKLGAEPPAGTRAATWDWARSYINRYATPENYAILDKLTAFAQERGHTLVELAIAWLLGEPQVSSVIAGVTSVEHLVANAKAADWKLTSEDMTQVRTILENKG